MGIKGDQEAGILAATVAIESCAKFMSNLSALTPGFYDNAYRGEAESGIIESIINAINNRIQALIVVKINKYVKLSAIIVTASTFAFNGITR